MGYGDLYKNSYLQKSQFPWMYNLPNQPIMTDPDYNEQANRDYRWENGIVAPQYAQGVQPQGEGVQSQGGGQAQITAQGYQGPPTPKMQGLGLPNQAAPGIPSGGSLQLKDLPIKGPSTDYMAIAGAGLTAATDLIDAFQMPDIDTDVSEGNWSGYNPTHGLGDDIVRQRGISYKGVVGSSIGSNAMKFAGTGASIASAIPGLGTAIGAAGGAVFGTLTGLVTGLIKRGKIKREKAKLRRNIAAAAEKFSDVNIKAKQEQQAKQIALQNL